MSRTDIHLNQLLRTNLDGVPLALASSLLPIRSRLQFSLLTHIHLHAKAQAKYASRAGGVRRPRVSRHRFLALLDNLASTVRGITWKPTGTEWGEYYSDTNYTHDAMRDKEAHVRSYLGKANSGIVWDLGANTGTFSRIAAESARQVISFDIDPAAVEKNYQHCRTAGHRGLLPLLMDLANPSPAIGWHHRERDSLMDRGPADLAMALALLHHLAITNNLPFGPIAAFLADVCTWLIIEFVPKADSQVQRLLSSRRDIFLDYDQPHFETAFHRYFQIVETHRIRDSERTLYLMRRTASP
jgi:hypothetical protein